MKEQLRALLRRFGIEVNRTGTWPTVVNFLADRRIEVVLDVGANQGQFAQDLRAKGYKGRIHSFEPVSSVADVLVKAAATDPDWKVETFALGATAHRATIRVAELSVFSSMLPSTEAAAQFGERSATRRTEEIEVRTLDEVLAPAVPQNAFLKIDTQGFERQVLEGAKRTLPHLKGVLLELPIIHLYQGNWRIHEAIAFMDQSGFVPAQFHPVNFHERDKMSLLEVDCLFRPRDPGIDVPADAT